MNRTRHAMIGETIEVNYNLNVDCWTIVDGDRAITLDRGEMKKLVGWYEDCIVTSKWTEVQEFTNLVCRLTRNGSAQFKFLHTDSDFCYRMGDDGIMMGRAMRDDYIGGKDCLWWPISYLVGLAFPWEAEE